jgi:outer membrane protein OmpA-like peptidoglycan-associated protein
MRINFVLFLTLALAAGATGCKKKMDRVTPLPGYGGSSRIGDAQPGNLNPGGLTPGGNTPTPSIGPDSVIPQTGARSIEGRPQDREKYKAQTVYFDFDRANVKAGEAAKVQEVASKFQGEDAATDLLSEGHCDERGTEEYNRSLGERRALALRELLVAAGVPADRVHTVSFGKDKPADPGHSESAYSKNRRGEFILVLPK